jgi:hypothetical protein
MGDLPPTSHARAADTTRSRRNARAVAAISLNLSIYRVSPSYSAGLAICDFVGSSQESCPPTSTPAWIDQIIDAVDALGVDDAGLGGELCGILGDEAIRRRGLPALR